jgi:hypothetical protein
VIEAGAGGYVSNSQAQGKHFFIAFPGLSSSGNGMARAFLFVNLTFPGKSGKVSLSGNGSRLLGFAASNNHRCRCRIAETGKGGKL